MPANPHKEIDPAIISAWTAAGALIDWLTRTEFGGWEYEYWHERPRGVDALPAFVWPEKAYERVAMNKLPAPSTPFAISLQPTRFNSNRFDELKGFQHLEALDLAHAAEFSPAWLNDLAALRNLRSLDLGAAPQVNDAVMEPLDRIPSLENLYFGSTTVSDVGLRTLAGFENLKTLYVYKTRVTDEGLKELAKCDSLETLLLYKTQITDAGVKKLARLPKLQTLGLISTAVTDASLTRLGGGGFFGFFGGGGFKSLRTVHLSETKTTPNGRNKLKRVRPDLSILF